MTNKYSFLILCLLLGLTACSNNSKPSNTQNNAKANSVSVIDLQALQSIKNISPTLAKHRTVFVGEQHDKYGDHLNQLSVVKNLHKHWKQNTSIGLEMVQQPYQSYLDDYISGKISAAKMLNGVQWYDRWRFDFRLYRPIFDYAKANKIPLVALNIPKELTQRITKVGINGLSKKERQQLPALIDKSDKIYIKRITRVFGKHSHTSSKGIEKFLDAQLAWDEGMAFAASKYLKKHTSKRMVILAGGGHIINRSGIPARLDRQLKTKSAVVLNNVASAPSPTQGDYLLFSPEVKLPPKGLMGIAMTDSKKGGAVKVLVKSVGFHSAASKAGINKGDVLLAVDGQTITASSDVLIWGLDKKPNDKVTLKIKRNNKVLLKKLVLRGKPTKSKHTLKPHHKKKP